MGNKKFLIKSWADLDLDKRIKKSIADLSYNRPMPIQSRTIRAALVDGKNILGAARTGSGKTLAFAIPIVSRILDGSVVEASEVRRALQKNRFRNEDFVYEDGANIEEIDAGVLENANILEESDQEAFQINKNIKNCPPDSDDDVEDVSESDGDAERPMTCPEAIILVPTRELATQVFSEIKKITTYTDIKLCCIIGGISQEKQLRQLEKWKPEIIVATPGRLYEMAQSDASTHLTFDSIGSVNSLVIDEVDRMTQRGHFEELAKIIDIIKESNVERASLGLDTCRVYMFSATLTFLHELPERLKLKRKLKQFQETDNIEQQTKVSKLKQLIKLFSIEAKNTKIIDLTDESHGRPSRNQLAEMKVDCSIKDKDFYLYYFILHNPGRSLIFCNSKDCLRRLKNVLKFLKIMTLELHADMTQKRRLASLDKFRREKNSIMIATDVAARGLDIENIDHVIHYQVPRTGESYIHRSGRTARVNKKGISLTLCEPKEIGHFRKICSTILNGDEMESYEIDTIYKHTIRERVRLAQQCDVLDYRLRHEKSEKNWFLKAAKDCEIELDDEELSELVYNKKSNRIDLEDQNRMRKKHERDLQKLSAKLNALLRKPITTRSTKIIENSKIIEKSKIIKASNIQD